MIWVFPPPRTRGRSGYPLQVLALLRRPPGFPLISLTRTPPPTPSPQGAGACSNRPPFTPGCTRGYPRSIPKGCKWNIVQSVHLSICPSSMVHPLRSSLIRSFVQSFHPDPPGCTRGYPCAIPSGCKWNIVQSVHLSTVHRPSSIIHRPCHRLTTPIRFLPSMLIVRGSLK